MGLETGLLIYLKSVGPSGKVIGLDFSENMLEIAKAKLKEEAKKNIEFLQEMQWHYC